MTTTTPTTSFITDFLTWRKTQIKTSYESSSKVDVTTLTAEKFMAIATTKDVTDSTTNTTSKQDMIKTESDSYLMNIILYHLDEKGLKALDTTKPKLADDVLATFSDTGYTTKLTKYAKLWLLSSIFEQNVNSKSPSRVKGDVVEKEFKEIQSDRFVTNVIMRLTFLATAKKCVDFLPYMYNSDTMIAKVQAYLLEDTYKTKWVDDAFAACKDKMLDKDFNDTERFTSLKSRLDILDPSFNLSSNVINQYYCELYARLGAGSIKKTPQTHKLFKKVTLDSIQKVLTNTDHEWYTILAKAKDMFKGNVASLANQISRAYLLINAETALWREKGVKSDHVFTYDSARFMFAMEKKRKSNNDPIQGLGDLWKDKTLHRAVAGIFILCNAAILFASFKSYDKMNTLDKILAWVNLAVSGVDIFTSIITAINSEKSAYTWVANKIADLMKSSYPPIRPCSAAKNVSKYAKYLKPTYVLKYINAALVLVSMAFTVYDIVTSIQNQDWGMLALSIIEFTLEFSMLVITFMAATSWSGPVSLMLTAALIVVGLVKIFWDVIKQSFTDVIKFFDKLFNGDPSDNFVKSTEASYQLTDTEYALALLTDIGTKYWRLFLVNQKVPDLDLKTSFFAISSIN
ncbi:hypothetical protein PPL_06408 [Heterostelium album PN500]|uniref:Uncharacterized protein n=1 Tax=Heterostelium pallidum (strain ATCC 26659 / Pp 5 / PN500) TaxID=670386 RepID=D3BD28_HETP5|nr:hypothetical protein PPL_06408 [Heterostelium album PN500]EFA80820.1 hypothetical protein PPL_06408 [Heterostelium album PN500]|eukprot:XP_020432939.1 hypothetical protein PPL_06408 [Heterostelium album PN500]